VLKQNIIFAYEGIKFAGIIRSVDFYIPL